MPSLRRPRQSCRWLWLPFLPLCSVVAILAPGGQLSASSGTAVTSSPVPSGAAAPATLASPGGGGSGADKIAPRESHFADLIQLTHGGQNAEAYWSPDGRELIFQSTRAPYACDQIFRLPADGSGAPVLVSTGKGRTTCSYFMPDGRRVLFSSTHAAGDACPPPADRSHGYVWAVYDTYEIWSARPDGSDLKRLTQNHAYDAESTVCPLDGSIIFTSDRDGDLELYRMNAEGGDVKRLTFSPGYDGGAYFSPDCKKIVWRASRPQGEELEDYRKLLAQGLVPPGKLEIWLANADGSDPRQLTYLDAASFAPSFFPSGDRIIFSSNYGDPKGREFELWAINTDGTGLERLTYSPGFDGFPMFSPDGKRLAFASNRGQGKPGETDVFVARWVDPPAPAGAAPPALPPADPELPPLPQNAAIADRFMAEVRWLADDQREGRGVGSPGLAAASRWLAERLRELGAAPGGEAGSYFQPVEVPVALEVGAATAVSLDGATLARADFQPAGFSGSGEAAGTVVAAGYGITAPELATDDYRGLDAAGKIVVVRRFTPRWAAANPAAERRYGDLRYKAYNAREHGARGLIVVDLPAPPVGTAGTPDDSPLPAPAVDASAGAGDAGIPVVLVKRAAGARLFDLGGHQAELRVALARRTAPAVNVVGVVRAGARDRLPGAVLLGAHYDHLGHGGQFSLEPDSRAVHHGADDNASGTAALLAAARLLAAGRDQLRRDVYVVAFTGEEEGLLGSTAFVRHPPAGLRLEDVVAMINMDMVGRLRGNQLAVMGTDSAAEWKEIVPEACKRALLGCTLGGDGYGPSDQSAFYAAGVPVTFLFTGAHADYHKPSDTADKVNAGGGAQIALLAADLARTVGERPVRLAYHSAPPPLPQGDSRSYGASLGTVPDYAGDGRPGVLIGAVRPGAAADRAGLRRGDLLVELAGTPIRDIYDFMYVLRRVRPGDTARAVVDRQGRRIAVDVVFSTSTRPN